MKRLILALAALFAFTAPLHAAEVQVEGLKVHYTVQGSGPAVLFVHGWTCDETSWRLQVPFFSRSTRVITIDLPGHGKSQVPAQDKFSMRLFTAAVEAVRAKVGADSVVLVGHSMGATVIGQYALKYPQHVAALVAADGSLVAPQPRQTTPMTRQQRETMINGMFVAATPAALRAEILKMMLDTSEVTAAGAFAAMFDPANQKDGQTTQPALSINAGTRPTGSDQATSRVFTRWQSTTIPGTGHFLMMEKPEEFNRVLMDFLWQSAPARPETATSPR
jgi:pimeloyl-ACP methyl ester carboxylesterase